MVVRSIYRRVRRSLLHRLIDAGHVSAAAAWHEVTVFGYLTLAVGLGEGARLCAEALARDRDLVVDAVDVGPSVGKRPEQAWSLPGAAPRTRGRPGVGIWHLNPPMMPPAILWFGRRRYRNQVNIAYWAWEFDALPREWVRAIRYVDAILVPSEFTAGAVRAHTDKPVLVVPHPVDPAPPPGPDMRRRLGLHAADFVAAMVFSFGSAMDRKNPAAVIDSFRRACPDGRAALVIKTAHGDRHPVQMAALVAAIGGAPDIHLVDEIWTREEIAGLIGGCDAFVSLHRSEGFGINILEAILAGVPVVTTGWSGNVDFCDPGAVSLVRATQVPLTPEQARRFDLPGGHWAEPDVAHAAALLRAVRTDRAAARARAAQARGFAVSYLQGRSYQAALNQVRDRLGVTAGSG